MGGGEGKLQNITREEWRRRKTTEHFWRWVEDRENYITFLEMRGGGAKLQTISGDEWRRGKSTEHSWR
jgi:hypothetical protein